MYSRFYSWGKKFIPLQIKRTLVVFYRKSHLLFRGIIRLFVNSLSRLSKVVIGRDIFFDKASARSVRRVTLEWHAPIELSETGVANIVTPGPFSAGGRKAESDTVEVVDLDDLVSSHGENCLLFVESGAAKTDYERLVHVADSDSFYIVFRAKKDYLDFLQVGASFCEDVDAVFERVSYIPTIDPVIDESVYLKADSLACEFIGSLTQSFSESSEYAKFSNFLRPMQVGVSDRFVGWVRNFKFILRFIELNGINKLYVFGGKLIDNNLLGISVLCNSNVSLGFIQDSNVRKFKSLKKLKVEDFITRTWVPSGKSTTTKYVISRYCKPGDDLFLFFGNLRDPMYRGTLHPVLDRFSAKTTKKLLVLLPYDDGVESSERPYSYVLPSVESDNMPGFDEFNNRFDFAMDAFLRADRNQSSESFFLALYVALNSRRSVHRLFRDCYGLMREVDEVSSIANVSALVSNPGRLWPSQFIVGYLKTLPSFDIQSGTFSKSARYKKPGSQHILAVDDFSKSVYVDYLGVDSANVEVVGAPRIDARLSDIREFTKQQSLELVSPSLRNYKILCIATQPYDIELMRSMVREACKFVSLNHDWFLLVSTHPNENDAFLNAYSREQMASGCESRIIISQGNIYHNLNASDAVITYFSTAGLEAFCLDKPVFAFRPENYSAVPFDLCVLGVAKAFGNSQELSKLLGSLGVGEEISQGLSRLKDGRSVQRICDFILEKVHSHVSVAN